jgi:uncharacterized NAD(P)/FAD-binding protein YdhS
LRGVSFLLVATMTSLPFRSTAIIGTGPGGLHTLHHLLQSDRQLMITLVEAGGLAGVGLPYGPETAEVTMLANIASIEIPPLSQSHLDWLRGQPEAMPGVHGVAGADLHERQLLPRLMLGVWFRDELLRMRADGQARGRRIALREGSQVVEVSSVDQDLRFTFATAEGKESLLFRHVVPGV